MLIIGVHQVPSLTQERYEQVVRRLTGKDHLESTSDLPFEDLLFHAAGQGKSGFCVVDVFESAEAVARFNQVMASIPRAVGIEEPPDFFPAHTFISGNRVYLASRRPHTVVPPPALRSHWPDPESAQAGRRS